MPIERKPWFRRLADVPGVAYDGSPGINRASLPGHSATPDVQVYEFDRKKAESLWWPNPEGGSSASPVHERAFSDPSDVPTEKLLRNVYEGLELPGEPADYHFLIQGCIDELWSRRRDEPDILAKVEELCHLNIQLVEACPFAVSYDADGAREYYGMSAFSCLIDLYEGDGFLREALSIAEKAARFGQGNDECDTLRERIAAIEAEDA